MPDDHRPLADTLYERDVHAWAERQASALLALGALRDDESAGEAALREALRGIDLTNVAEEIESLGRSDRRALRSRLEMIVEHLTKLEHALDPEPRRGWKVTVARERAAIGRLLRESPSLRPLVPDAIREMRPEGLDRAIDTMASHGDSGADRARRRGVDHLGEAEVLGDWWPDEPGP